MLNREFELYKLLYLSRRCEEHIIMLYPDDEMRTPMHMSMGQEAIPVGVCYAVRGTGDVFASYRSHATFLALTEDTDQFFAELYGRVTGTAEGKAGSMHLSAPDRGHLSSSAIVGSGIPSAVGAAFANRSLETGRIALVFFGDGALGGGAFWESLNAACAMSLPILFVCEDNGLAVHTRTDVRNGFRSIVEVVRQFECAVFDDASNDVETIFDLTVQAVDVARQENKPVFLCFQCCRYLEHVGIYEDWDAGYRQKSEFAGWFQRDCVQMQRRRLLELGMNETEIAAAEEEIERKIRDSVTRAQKADHPSADRLDKGVFHEAR